MTFSFLCSYMYSISNFVYCGLRFAVVKRCLLNKSITYSLTHHTPYNSTPHIVPIQHHPIHHTHTTVHNTSYHIQQYPMHRTLYNSTPCIVPHTTVPHTSDPIQQYSVYIRSYTTLLHKSYLIQQYSNTTYTYIERVNFKQAR